MASQAIITLTAISPGIVPPKRVLTLNPECQTVHVGRASKSISKGLVSAEDNAWFDNPVMSRDHAELILKQEEMSIAIKDVHSMHGTQINNEKLSPDATQNVKIGDILSFGAEVRRGPEVFPPCRFRVDYEFMPWTRGFQFPDSSDIDDEQEEEARVDDSQDEEMTPVETPPPKPSMSTDAVDLTSDDGGQAEQAELAEGPRGVSAEELAADKLAMGLSATPIVIQGDSEEEEEDDSEADNQLDYDDSEEESDDDSDKENNEESDAEEGTDDAIRENTDFDDSINPSTWNDDMSEGNDNESSQGEDVDCILPSDTGVKAFPTLGQNYPQVNGNTPLVAGPSYVWQTAASSVPKSTMLTQESSPVRQPSPSDAAMAKSQTINPSHLSANQFHDFMAQTRAERANKKDFFEAREINRARISDEESRNAEHGSMGDGIIRPRFDQLGHPYNPRPSGPGPVPNIASQQAQYLQRQQLLAHQLCQGNLFVPSRNTHAQPRNFPEHLALAQKIIHQRIDQVQAQAQVQGHTHNTPNMIPEQSSFSSGSPLTSMPLTNSFTTFNQQQVVEPEIQGLRAPSPELDMTSAARFNESKVANAAVQPSRSAVRINDIVDPLVSDSDVNPCKRKASDISVILEEEVRVWASKDASFSRVEAINPADIGVQTENKSTPSKPVLVSTSEDAASAEPTHKRIKKFAEVVGYTALGGLAGGVALFSALVATAPDFL